MIKFLQFKAAKFIIPLMFLSCVNCLLAFNKKTTVKQDLKNSALVTRSSIKADCLIKSEASAAITGELTGIQLGYIPDPLGELVIEEKELREKLGKFANQFNLPEKVTIKRRGSILKGSVVKEKIKEFCQAKSEDDLKIDISRIPTNIILPGNLIKWEIKPNSDNLLGMRLFNLSAETDGGKFRQLFQVNVVKIIEAAQLNSLAKPGQKLTADMINKKPVEIASEHTNLPLTYQQALGKRLGRYKSPGTIVRNSDIFNQTQNICLDKKAKKQSFNTQRRFNDRNKRANWAIKPGEKVEYHFANGTLELTLPAKAVEGGAIGDQIHLINLRNHKRIKGIITDRGRVEYAKN
ncbi:MAG: flagella basal body P-ring formation protein FlgA [Candidatus Rifleibacteriota bacterium]